jgi:hypothetical protein
MKKLLVLSFSMLLVLSSCGTYTGAGAVTGAQFGSIIGSAIGGISGGWRGHDVGTLVGMAGGAAVGAAIGAAADQKVERRYEQRQSSRYDNRGEASVYDDRIMFDEAPKGVMTHPNSLAAPSPLRIENLQFVDAANDGCLVRGESARVVFEIRNTSSKPVYSVQPSVTEVTGNKHIHISENILIESIAPGKGVRYTASIKGDNGLRDGEAVIRIGVLQANKEVSSQTRNFTIVTRKK